MRLETSRLVLREYSPEDWERIHIYGSQPEFSKYELWGPNTVEDSKKFIADMIKVQESEPLFAYNFAVCEKASGLLIGGCSIRREGYASVVANLGWAINPDFQSRGYATEAAARLIEFGLKDLGLRVIYATCDTRNAPSYRVMEKLGMKRVGLKVGDKITKGHKRDTYRYELV